MTREARLAIVTRDQTIPLYPEETVWVEKVGKTRIRLSMKALDGGTYKAVVDIERNPLLKTFYKEGKQQ